MLLAVENAMRPVELDYSDAVVIAICDSIARASRNDDRVVEIDIDTAYNAVMLVAALIISRSERVATADEAAEFSGSLANRFIGQVTLAQAERLF